MNSTPSADDIPVVTVLMAVRDGAAFLREAIESILRQTFSEFEFAIINDASTDGTRAIIQSYSDPRIFLIDNTTPMGVAASLNRGLDLAKGAYIARMDCDDVSLPDRLERQVEYLEANHHVCVCGSWAELIDEGGRKLGVQKRPFGKQMQQEYWIPSPVVHPSAMIRRSQLGDMRYDEKLNAAEDYDLWLRLNKVCTIDNIPKILLRYRIHKSSATSRRRTEQLQETYEIFMRHTGISDIAYEDFISLIGASYRLSPIKRMFLSSKLARRLGMVRGAFLHADALYFKQWLLNACCKP